MTVSGTERNRRARTKGWTWDVPYCVRCKAHVRATERAMVALLLFGAAFCLIAFLAAVLAAKWPWLWQASVLPASGLGGSVAWIRRANRLRAFNCCGLSRAVVYLGSDIACHSFDIRSPFYAAEFVRANHRKLVNVSPQVAGILRGTDFGKHQVPRRLYRKGR